MSRSYRHSPILGITASGINRSEKKDKRRANRKFRRLTHYCLKNDERLPVDLDEVSEVYTWTKDGKQFLDDPRPEDLRK